MPPKIIPLAMIICDTVITDVQTKKKSLIGMFNRINAKKAPITHPSMSIHLALTEGHGKYECELRCLFSRDDKLIFKSNGTISFSEPTQVADLTFNLAGVALPKFGDYRFEFYAEGKLVITRKLAVLEIKKEEK